jgi:hypothetical protein
MATAAATSLAQTVAIARGVYIMDWNGTVAGVGNPFTGPAFLDVSFQVQGPTGGTSNVVIEGTFGAVASTATWVILESVSGGAMNYTNVTGGIIQKVRSVPRMIRPNFVTVTTGKTLSVRMIAKEWIGG